MLYVIDLEDTLVESYMRAPGKNYAHLVALEGRKGALSYLQMKGHKVAIITNQGGVGYGMISEEAAVHRLDMTKGLLGLPQDTRVYISMHHPQAKDPKWKDPQGLERRMPNPHMIYEAIVEHGALPEETVFICNFKGHKDTAKNAGIIGMTWDEFAQTLAVESVA